jgi:hypothetical protein
MTWIRVTAVHALLAEAGTLPDEVVDGSLQLRNAVFELLGRVAGSHWCVVLPWFVLVGGEDGTTGPEAIGGPLAAAPRIPIPAAILVYSARSRSTVVLSGSSS